MKTNKGKFFLKFAARALLLGLREVPGVGMALDLADEWQEASRELRQQQDAADQEERLARIEAALALTPAEAREAAAEAIAEIRAEGGDIAMDKEAAVLDIAAAIPSTIREKTQATLRQARQQGTAPATVLPIGALFSEAEQDDFYRSLFPLRRPRFQAGDPVPGGHPRWVLEAFLGAGGFGEVWEARHLDLDDRFAVKFCLDDIGSQVMQREAVALMALRQNLPTHPNIVRLVDVRMDEEPYWLAFDYMEGGTLEARMRAAPFSLEQALDVFIPILRGMAAVHEAGIIHRDLKPANILLDGNGTPQIADFGIGKVSAEQAVAREREAAAFTTQGFGSLGYMPPEQADGQVAHPADDVYALGVMLWQMLANTLKPPQYLRSSLESLDVPDSVKTLLLDCLEKPREQRPADAGVLLARLDAFRKSPSRHPLPEEEGTKSPWQAIWHGVPLQAKNAWWAAALIWLPLLLPIFGHWISGLPLSGEISSDGYIFVVILIAIGAGLTARFGTLAMKLNSWKDVLDGMGLLFLAIPYAFIIAIFTAGDIAGYLRDSGLLISAISLALGVAFVLAGDLADSGARGIATAVALPYVFILANALSIILGGGEEGATAVLFFVLSALLLLGGAYGLRRWAAAQSRLAKKVALLSLAVCYGIITALSFGGWRLLPEYVPPQFEKPHAPNAAPNLIDK